MTEKILKFPKKPLFLNIIIWLSIFGFILIIVGIPKYFANFNLSSLYTIAMTVIGLIAVFGLIKLKKWGIWSYVVLELFGLVRIFVEILFTDNYNSLSKQLMKLPPELYSFFSIAMIVMVVIALSWSLVQIIYLIKIRKLFK